MKIIFKKFTLLSLEENQNLLEIRNSDYVRFHMENSNKIEYKDHLQFIEKLKNSSSIYFSVILDSQIIGAVYVNQINGNNYLGLYFKEEINPLISSISTFLFLDYIFLNIYQNLQSFVKKENSMAFSFNKNFGFELYKEDENYFYLELEKQKWENRKNSKLLKPIKNYLDKIDFEFK